MQKLCREYYKEPVRWMCREGKKGSGYWIIECQNGTLGHVHLDGDGKGEVNARLAAAAPVMKDAIINTIRALELESAGVCVDWKSIKTMLENAVY